MSFKGSGEIVNILIAERGGNIGNRGMVAMEHFLGFADSKALDIVNRRSAHHLAKKLTKINRRKTGKRGEIFVRYPFIVIFCDVIEGGGDFLCLSPGIYFFGAD